MVYDLTGANYQSLSLENLGKEEKDKLHKKIVESFQKGYLMTANMKSEKLLRQANTQKNGVMAIVTCKKLRIGEAIHNLVKVLNPYKFVFTDNKWSPTGPSWNEKLKKELRYFTEEQKLNVEWLDIQTFCAFFETISIYRINSTDRNT